MEKCFFCGGGNLSDDIIRSSVLEEHQLAHAMCDKMFSSFDPYKGRLEGEHKLALIKETQQLPTPKHDIQCSKCNRSFDSFKNPNSKRSRDRPQCKQCGERIETPLLI